jgi:hypothetical protein
MKGKSINSAGSVIKRKQVLISSLSLSLRSVVTRKLECCDLCMVIGRCSRSTENFALYG